MQTFLSFESSNDDQIIESSENELAIKTLQENQKYVLIDGPKKSGKSLLATKFSSINNKKMIYKEFLDKHNLNNSETVFMGDDLPDITILQVCGLSSCPNDACPEVRSIVEYISIKNGGMGCVRDIIEQTLKAQGKWKLNENSKNI